ncbi:MAG: hypothetical protein KDC16_05485 [Saprospiraceae bacterium]|nr:hypothetical protein [Saprospiraceae bacterium]
MGKLVRQVGNIDKNLHKKEIVELAKDNAQAVIESGKYDLLKVYVELKRYEAYLKGLIYHLKSSAMEKASEKGKKSFDYNDARINLSSRTKWDFSIDKQWSDLDLQIQNLSKERKEREKYLLENNIVQSIVDEETGEIKEEFILPKEIKFGISVRL